MSVIERYNNVLGINGRNINFVYKYNKRSDFHIVDNKLETKKILDAANIPTSKLIAYASYFYQLENLEKEILKYDSFVIKPARGLAGGGILILKSRSGKYWNATNGKKYSASDILKHSMDILYGVYSMDNDTDSVIIEEMIIQHDFFNSISPFGISDIRVIVLKGVPVMAMCRIPTKKSDGKANVTLGAIGAGIDLDSGWIVNAVTKKGSVTIHTDSQKEIIGLTVPFWKDIISISKDIANHVPLRYYGVDIALDENYGPLIIELNARPGLEIQNATRMGLRESIKKEFSRKDIPEYEQD